MFERYKEYFKGSDANLLDEFNKLFSGFPEKHEHEKVSEVTTDIMKGQTRDISLVALSMFIMQFPVNGLPMHLPVNSRTAHVESLTTRHGESSMREVALSKADEAAGAAGRKNFKEQSVAVLAHTIATITDEDKDLVKPEGMVNIDFCETMFKTVHNVKLRQESFVGKDITAKSLMLLLALFNYPPISTSLSGLLISFFMMLHRFFWDKPEYVRNLLIDKSRLGTLFEGEEVLKLPDYKVREWLRNTV